MESHLGFLIFNILFEVTSGYGTVGLTTGVPYDSYALSGAFHELSKVIIFFIMVRGRHRGLPLAIDRSILIPGEELLHQMDEEYNDRPEFSMDKEKEVRRDEEQSGVKETEPGKGMADQDPERETGKGMADQDAERETGDRRTKSDWHSKWGFEQH